MLVDTGFGSGGAELELRLASAGVTPADVDLVVNTHWHSDHVGGNHRWQADHGVAVAAARADADAVNRRDPAACLAEWLDQPVEAYRVDHPLDHGDVVFAGEAEWQVLATPGHTPNHISLYQPDERVLVLGDLVHADDIGWINLALDGPAAVTAAIRSVELLADLPVRYALPGHGGAIDDPPSAFARALERLGRFAADPHRVGWHACKRIFAFALMIRGGIAVADVHAYLVGRPWLADHAVQVFGTTPDRFAAELLAEMRRAGAVREQDGVMVAATPHESPGRGWLTGSGRPRDW